MIIVGYFWISHEINRFKHEADLQRTRFIESQKALIKSETEKAIDFINYHKSRMGLRIKKNIRDRVNEAYSIAYHLYDEYKGKLSDQELIKLIKDTLRPIRFNSGRGYYFAIGIDGNILLFADRPESEGNNWLDLQDSQGQYALRDIIDIVQKSGEGYYTYHWTKPKMEGRNFPKLAFVKYFEPLQMIIGTGEYLDDTEKEIQQEVIERLIEIRFNHEGYLFGSTFRGEPLFTNGKITINSGSIWELTDPNGIKIIQEQSRLAQTPEGGYLQYSWRKLSTSEPSPKISFVKGVKDWEWTIGAGCYIDDIEVNILQMRTELHQTIRQHIEKILLVLVTLVICIFAVSKYISYRVRLSFNMVSKFFHQAAVEHLRIDPGQIFFEELINLANSANYMLEERMKIENELKANEERFQLAIRGTNDGLWDWNIETKVPYFSDRCKTMLGYEPTDAFTIDSWQQLIYPEDFERVITELNSYLYGKKESFEHTYRMIHKNGQIIWVMNRCLAVRDSNGNPVRIVGFITDITSQKQAEQALAEEKELLTVTLRSIGEGVIATDIQNNVVLMNKVAEKFTGWDSQEAVGKPVQDIFQLMDIKSQSNNLHSENVRLQEFSLLTQHPVILISRHGEKRTIEGSTAPIRDKESRTIGTVLVFRDITEKMQMEEAFQKKRKLESIGILAGGIAHDFNNILTALLGNLTLAKLYAESNEKVIKKIDRAEAAVMKAKKLTYELLTFAKGGDPIKKILDIKPLVEESAQFALSGSNVKLVLHFSENLPRVNVDENQIKQVIHHIVLNADQAMPEGGTIEIFGEIIDLLEMNPFQLPAGSYIRLIIKDQGIGIPEEHLDKIFDPYFTTKEMGHGLGLATSFSIIRKHQGTIDVKSKVGEGTSVILYLPIVPQKSPLDRQVMKKKPLGRSLSILLMDDETMILDVTSALLENLGYQVETAKEGKEVIEKYQKNLNAGKSYDVVILDLTIPGGMGGRETLLKLKEIDPNVKAIVSSGYSNDPIMSHYKEYGFEACIVKPFRMEELRNAIEMVQRIELVS